MSNQKMAVAAYMGEQVACFLASCASGGGDDDRHAERQDAVRVPWRLLDRLRALGGIPTSP